VEHRADTGREAGRALEGVRAPRTDAVENFCAVARDTCRARGRGVSARRERAMKRTVRAVKRTVRAMKRRERAMKRTVRAVKRTVRAV